MVKKIQMLKFKSYCNIIRIHEWILVNVLLTNANFQGVHRTPKTSKVELFVALTNPTKHSLLDVAVFPDQPLILFCSIWLSSFCFGNYCVLGLPLVKHLDWQLKFLKGYHTHLHAFSSKPCWKICASNNTNLSLGN